MGSPAKLVKKKPFLNLVQKPEWKSGFFSSHPAFIVFAGFSTFAEAYFDLFSKGYLKYPARERAAKSRKKEAVFHFFGCGGCVFSTFVHRMHAKRTLPFTTNHGAIADKSGRFYLMSKLFFFSPQKRLFSKTRHFWPFLKCSHSAYNCASALIFCMDNL